MNLQLQSLLQSGNNTHLLYSYSSMTSYIDQAIDYILHGISEKEKILFIDNERLFPQIYAKVEKLASKEDLTYIHYVKNFDFYHSSGSYHPPAIIDYFNNTVSDYIAEGIPFRSWAHVEWATMTEPLEIIRELEEHIDWAVNALPFSLICAYDQKRMPSHLTKILEETHPYLLTDNTLVPSANYKQQFTLEV